MLTKSSLIALAAGTIVGGVSLASDTVLVPAQPETETVLLVQQEKTGTITGVVVNPSGQPVAKVPVLLFDMSNGLDGPGGGRQGRESLSADAVGLQSKGKQGPSKWGKPIGKTLTDATGKFTFPNKLKPGYYRIEAGNRRVTGFRADSVQVKAGEKTEVKVQLTPPR